MNRLVLIGNGFDLAHGLKTSYVYFINWYWREWGRRLASSGHKFEEDEFCSFVMNESLGLSGWYLVRNWYFQKMNMDFNEFVQISKKDTNLCEFKYKSPFFEQINKNIETRGWVNIESEYYRDLIGSRSYGNRKKKVIDLNKDLDYLKVKLIEYLKLEETKKCNLIDEIRDKIYRPIKEREIAISYGIPGKDLFPTNVLLLNFNYTSTPQMYLGDNSNINYIHGILKHSQNVIFGYGDELDDNYPKLQKLNDNDCLRNIKSIRYLELDCYRNVLKFIESDPFQICIMGHSCGNSDRTLLNTLFEHRNCVSIKPYYYQKDDGSDNYNELVMNISRNFTDMKLMRDRVVSKTYTEPLVNTRKLFG